MKTIFVLMHVTEKLSKLFIRGLYRMILVTLFGFTALAQNGTQTIRGSVVDRDSKQPLIGATITVINGKTDRGGVTDVAGNFKISGIPFGRKSLKVTYIGYETLTYPDIIVTAGKEIVLTLSMVESVTKIDEVTIKYDRRKDPTVTNNEMATVSSRSFNPDDTKKYAGALGDPSRMAANFAGVIAGNDSRNDIVVRGNSPNAMLWQMEGVNIPNPNHFGSAFNTGGPVSMLNANNIGKSDFFTGAFPAQYGNANGGAFDLVMREGNNEKREYVAQVGFNGVEFGAEGPFSKNSKSSFLFNYRYSTIGLMNNVGVNVGTGAAIPLYQDINFKITVPTKGKGKFAIWGLGGMSSIDLLAKDVDTTDINFYGSKDENTLPRYRSGVVGTSYEKNLSPKTWARFSLAFSHISNEYTVDSVASLTPTEITYPKASGDFIDNKLSAVVNVSHKVNARNSIHGGFSNDFTRFDYFNKDVHYMGTVDSVRVDQQGSINLTQAYIQWKHRFNVRFSSNFGFHTQYLNINKQIVIEPRLGLKYAINNQSSINAGYGLHHQTIPVYNMFVKNDQGVESNKDLKYMRSNHFIIGYENMLGQFIRIKLESYFQYLDQIPVNDYPSPYSALNVGSAFEPSDETDLVNNGTGQNYGIELTLERFYNKGFYFLITGSVFNSEYKGSDGIERNTAFNTNYAANILGGKEIKVGKNNNVLYLNFKLTTVGGKYITPIDVTESQNTGTAQYDYSKSFSEKQEPYFRCDVKTGYRKDYKKSSMEFAIDFQNITNHQNIFSQGYNKYTNSITYNYQTGFFPVPMFRFTF